VKAIQQLNKGKFSTAETIRQLCSVAPNGTDVDGMRLRCSVLDAIDKAGEDKDILLEDAQYAVVRDAANNPQTWRIADRDLLSVIDGILGAKTVQVEAKKAA
jgi:hypothetical protein